MSSSQSIEDALQKASQVRSYDSAQILSGSDSSRAELLLSHSLRDLSRNKKRRVSTFTSFASTAKGVINDEAITRYSFEEKDEVTMSAAHDYVDGQRVLFRTCDPDKPGKDKRLFVERWSSSSMLKSIEVTDYHGAFNGDVMFGKASFHRGRHSRIAYIAEAKKPDLSSPHKYAYEDDWGEKLGGIRNPVVVILDFDGGLLADELSTRKYGGNPDDATVTNHVIISHAPKNSACGEVIFAPENPRITYVATDATPRRYGLIYCFNRRSVIYHSTYAGAKPRQSWQPQDHVRSPQYAKDGSLYFLSNPSSGAHFQCSSLHRRKPDTSQTECLISDIDEPKDYAPKYDLSFHGIYTDRLKHVDTQRIVFNTQSQSTQKAMIAYMSPADGSIMGINSLTPNDDPQSSWTIIGSGKGQIILANHAPTGSISLRHIRLRDGHTTPILKTPSPFPSLSQTSIETHPSRPNVSSILHLPQTTSKTPLNPSDIPAKPPLIAIPHGGPHTAHSTTYNTYTTALLHLGAAVLQVNYTGSTGFGASAINSLVGKIGDVDVEDVHAAVQQQIDAGSIDPNRICVMGGSHGGFIGAWLLGRYPTVYKCGILLNPVVNLAAVGAGSDIPDWAVSESVDPGGAEDGKAGRPTFPLANPPLPSAETYATLLSKSPITVAHNVTSPVCMILGEKDKRVPNYEGKNYVAALRTKFTQDGEAREVPRVSFYEFEGEGHSLDGDEAFKGVWECVGGFVLEEL